MICEQCGFDTDRPRGHIFITKSVVDYAFIDSVICQKCNRVPDWVLWQDKPKTARIIYRNFEGSEEYFDNLKKELEKKGYVMFDSGEIIEATKP